MKAKTFFYMALACPIALLLALGLFNWLVNPILLFESPDIKGFNLKKSQWFYSQFLTKPYAVRRRKPNALILGTSRSGFTLDPSHPGWDNYDSYNYALAGTTMMVQWHSFVHANHVRPVKRVLLGLDLYMFNACREQHREKPMQDYLERLRGGGPEIARTYPRRLLQDYADTLLSADITRKSWRTVLSQEPTDVQQLHAHQNGLWQNGIPAHRPQRQLFRIIERQYIGSDWFPAPDHCYALQRNGSKPQLEYLEKFLKLARSQKTEVVLIFSPFHARLGEAMRVVGIWPEFEQLKREVVALVESLAIEERVEPYPIWDFSGYNQINNEPVPGPGNTDVRMKWYLDGTHGTAELGKLVQDTLLAETQLIPDFGRQLESSSLESWLATINLGADKYRNTHTRDVEEIFKSAKRFNAVADLVDTAPKDR